MLALRQQAHERHDQSPQIRPDPRQQPSRAGAVKTPVAARAESGAAPKPRMARSSAQDLAVDHHRDEEQREIEQRELVDRPRRLGPLGGAC